MKGGNEFVLVDAAAKTKAPAFDHARLAAALVDRGERDSTPPSRCRSPTFTFADNQQAIEFTIGRRRRRGAGGGGGGAGRRRPAARHGAAVALHAHRLHVHARDRRRRRSARRRAVAARAAAAAGAAAPRVRRARPQAVRISPDGKWEALIQNFNVYVRPVRRPAAHAARRARASC